MICKLREGTRRRRRRLSRSRSSSHCEGPEVVWREEAVRLSRAGGRVGAGQQDPLLLLRGGGRHGGFRAEAGRSLTCVFTGPAEAGTKAGRTGEVRQRSVLCLRIMLPPCSTAVVAPHCPWREPELLSPAFKAPATRAGLLPPAPLSPPQPRWTCVLLCSMSCASFSRFGPSARNTLPVLAL